MPTWWELCGGTRYAAITKLDLEERKRSRRANRPKGRRCGDSKHFKKKLRRV